MERVGKIRHTCSFVSLVPFVSRRCAPALQGGDLLLQLASLAAISRPILARSSSRRAASFSSDRAGSGRPARRRSWRRSGPPSPPGCRWASGRWPAGRPGRPWRRPSWGCRLPAGWCWRQRRRPGGPSMPAAQRITPKPACLPPWQRRPPRGGAVGRKDVGLKGDVQGFQLGAGALDHRPVAVRTHDNGNFTNHTQILHPKNQVMQSEQKRL